MIPRKHLLGIVLSMAATTSLFAGNIPQYSISTDGAPYSAIEGTKISCKFENDATIGLFPIGERSAPFTSTGFDLGFDFKFGGRWFDQFVISSAGDLYLGEGSVTYSDSPGDSFRISMSPIIGGVKKADISYLTSGEEGSKVLTVQYANAQLNESGTDPGLYNLQIRLYEEDGHAEIAFQELRTVANNNKGFATGLSGWDDEDVLVITATDINAAPKVSTFKKAYMLDPESYVHWKNDESGRLRSVSYKFSLNSNTVPPKSAPTNLTLTQAGSDLNISVTRGRDARATVVLCSTEPISASDLPADGETFLAGTDQTIGNAMALYYGPAREINVTMPGIKDGTDYYVAAISANGYPAFNVDNMAQEVFRTAQSAPSMLLANATGTTTIDVECAAKDNVIIAATGSSPIKYRNGYVGLFGEPTSDMKVGDMIQGGGKVIYVGEPSKFTYECEPNQITFFRAWTLRKDRVSSNSIDAHAIPDVSMPYAPGIENYPYGEQIEKWTTGPTGYDLAGWNRGYYMDRAVYGLSPADYTGISLTTPELPLDTPVTISFEFAMETIRDAAATPESGGILLPQGSEPGWFGDQGYLRIKTGETVHKTVTSYEGTMVGFDETGYNDDSSTFVPVSVDIAAQGGTGKITFEISTQKASRMFFRNFVITPSDKVPEAPKSAPSDIKASEDADGLITINCKRGEDAVYTLVLFSDKPMTDAEIPTDGHLYKVGDHLGDATVLYFGTDEEIECMTAYMLNGAPEFIFAEFDTDYYIRAISGSDNPLYNTDSMTDLKYHSLPDSGVDGIDSDSREIRDIYTVTGVRLNTTDVKSLPSGLYIINGHKVIVK